MWKKEQEKAVLLEKIKKEKQEAEKLRTEKINSIKTMWENGVAKEMIALFMGLSMSDVEDYLKEIEKSKKS